MKSPFPGMDPFLEPKWPEVHASLIVYARNQLNSLLPTDLQANIEENLEPEQGGVYFDQPKDHWLGAQRQQGRRNK